MSLVGLMLLSRPAAQKIPLIDIRLNPSFNRSSDAPCVVVNTRPDLPDAARYSRYHATGSSCLSLAGGESGVMPSRIRPSARTWLPSIGAAVYPPDCTHTS